MGVQRHCINDCADKERYQEMLNAHQAVSNRQRKQPEHRVKRIRQMRRDLGSAADGKQGCSFPCNHRVLTECAEAYDDRDGV